jgi:hypothetical protein
MRRVNKGSHWFAADDNLRGTSEYGLKNARIDERSEFSIRYSKFLWSATEFLFKIGMRRLVHCTVSLPNI